MAPQCHAVQLCWGYAAASTRWAGPGDEDMLGDLHRNHRQLDDFPGALDPAASQVRPAIGTALHHVLHPMGRCHAPAGEAVASLLSGLLLRWRLAARTGLEAGHSGRAARFRLAFQFGNPPLQPLNHPLLFQNGGLQLGDDGDENIATGGGQVNFGIHSLYMTQPPPPVPAFGNPPSANLLHQV